MRYLPLPVETARRCAALSVVAAFGCGDDAASPKALDLSGTYSVAWVVGDLVCAPLPWPAGPWNPDGPPHGGEGPGTWEVEHSAAILTIHVSQGPPRVGEEATIWTLALEPDRTFSLGPRLVIEGTINTDDGDREWALRETLEGSVTTVSGIPRITVVIDHTHEFRQLGSQELVTTCTLTSTADGARTSD